VILLRHVHGSTYFLDHGTTFLSKKCNLNPIPTPKSTPTHKLSLKTEGNGVEAPNHDGRKPKLDINCKLVPQI